MTKTFKELMEIDNEIGLMYKNDPNLEGTKFGYNYKRFAEKNWYPQSKAYNDVLGDIQVENARIDPATQKIMQDPISVRGFEYTKDGLKAVILAERRLRDEWEVKEIDVEPRLCAPENVPELTSKQKELFSGVIINSVTESSEQNKED